VGLYLFFSVIALVIYFQAAVYFLVAMPRSRVNAAFIAAAGALCWFTFFLLLFQAQDEVSRTYYYDKWAVFGWASFPVLFVVLFWFLARPAERFFKKFIQFFLLPSAILMTLRYLWDPGTIKFFVRQDGIWYYSVSHDTPWIYLFALYVLACGGLCIYFLYRWMRASASNRERLQSRVVLVSLVLVSLLSLVTNVALPMAGNQSVPASAHIHFFPLVIGLFVSLTTLRLKPFPADILSHLVSQELKEYVLFFDPDGRVIQANRFCRQALGYQGHELKGMEAGHLVGDPPGFMEGFQQTRDLCKRTPVQVDLLTARGEKVPVRGVIAPVVDSLQRLTGIVFSATGLGDIHAVKKKLQLKEQEIAALTDRTQSLERLLRKRRGELAEAREQLRIGGYERLRAEEISKRDEEDRERLVQEVHHRVKNNMQMVVSLVNMLRTHREISPEAASGLAGLSDRIRTISGILEDIYATPYLSRINFGQFLQKATGEIYSKLRPDREFVFHMQVSDEYLPVDQAIPCGLAFFELLANAIGHSFPSGPRGGSTDRVSPLVAVAFYREKDEYVLQVRDNGVGIPKAGEPGTDAFMTGLKLVEQIASDHLKGTLHVRNSSGTIVNLRFKRSEGEA